MRRASIQALEVMEELRVLKCLNRGAAHVPRRIRGRGEIAFTSAGDALLGRWRDGVKTRLSGAAWLPRLLGDAKELGLWHAQGMLCSSVGEMG